MARPARCPAPAMASASRARSGIRPAGTPALSRPNATSRSTDPSTAWPSGSWNTIPAARAIRPGRVVSVSRPATLTRPPKRPPWKWGTSPHSARSSVDFPSPEGPSSSRTSPAARSRSTPRSAGSGAPPYANVEPPGAGGGHGHRRRTRAAPPSVPPRAAASASAPGATGDARLG